MHPRAGSIRRRGRVVLAAGLAVLLVPLAPLAVVAETPTGRLTGILALAGLAAVVLGLSPWRADGRAWAACGMLAVAAAVPLAILASRPVAPPDDAGIDRGLRAYVVGRPGAAWAGSRGVLPEADLVRLGSQVASRVVPWVRADHARRIRDVPAALYREVEADPAGQSLAPAYPMALAELLGLTIDTGHYFAYVPGPRPGERPGAVVVLHGNGGNFKVLPWAWRRLAEEHGLAIVCPTFGYGFWGPGGVEAVERVRADAVTRLGLDPGRVYLAGISDGGKGVTRTGAALPDAYRGLIYLSPTMVPAELADAAFAEAWRDRPVFVATGGLDWNVRPETVDAGVDLLRSAGARVEYLRDPNEDHLYFFARLDFLLDRIGAWLERN